MKLLLTSSGQFITKYPVDTFLPKKIIESKIAYIITASHKVLDRTYLERHKERMDELHFNYVEYDLEGKRENELYKDLQGFDIILVEGGNTFCLLKAIRESGFEKVIRKLLSKGAVYVGSSAGTYVACPSIVMATLSKQNFDTCGITRYGAMNLVPFLIKAHFVPEDIVVLQEKAKVMGYPIRAITDDQAIWTDGNSIRLVGTGDDVVFSP